MPFQTGGAAGVSNLSGLTIDTDKDWKGYSILNFVADLGDDQKIFLGADDDYSIRYDSADDTFYIQDEVNATEVEIPKNVAMDIAAHEARHESGGADEIPAGGLVAGADPRSSSHETRHESGGADAIPSGSLNPQDPTAHETSHESGGADALPLANLPMPGDDTKVELGAGPDFSIFYDSANDDFRIRDEVNGVETNLPKNVAMNIAGHAARHDAGGADELFDQSLNTTDNVQFAQVSVADIVMDNDWRLTEHPDYGIVLKSPEGRIFKLIVEELK